MLEEGVEEGREGEGGRRERKMLVSNVSYQ